MWAVQFSLSTITDVFQNESKTGSTVTLRDDDSLSPEGIMGFILFPPEHDIRDNANKKIIKNGKAFLVMNDSLK